MAKTARDITRHGMTARVDAMTTILRTAEGKQRWFDKVKDDSDTPAAVLADTRKSITDGRLEASKAARAIVNDCLNRAKAGTLETLPVEEQVLLAIAMFQRFSDLFEGPTVSEAEAEVAKKAKGK
jgi:hypothetical protein